MGETTWEGGGIFIASRNEPYYLLCDDNDERRKRIFRDSLISFPPFFFFIISFCLSLSLSLSRSLHATIVTTKPPRTNLIVARRVVGGLSFPPSPPNPRISHYSFQREIFSFKSGEGEIIFPPPSLHKVARPMEKNLWIRDPRKGRNVNLRFVCSH